MEDKKNIFSVNWTQHYELPQTRKLSMLDLQLIAMKMIEEESENIRLEESGYVEANQIINQIKSKDSK